MKWSPIERKRLAPCGRNLTRRKHFGQTQHLFSPEIAPDNLFPSATARELDVHLTHLLDLRGVRLVVAPTGDGHVVIRAGVPNVPVLAGRDPWTTRLPMQQPAPSPSVSTCGSPMASVTGMSGW